MKLFQSIFKKRLLHASLRLLGLNGYEFHLELFVAWVCTIVNYILGTDYTVQFHPLDVHGVSNVMSTLNSAIRSLFDRLTSDMAPHDQIRLILNSHQLD